MIGIGLGGRSIGLGLGRTAGGAAATWWTAGGVSASDVVAAYQPKGAASLEASYVNLAHPGVFDAAPGVAPTWDAATGWTFNGSGQYLDTGIIIFSTWTAIISFASVANTGYIFGISGSSRSFSVAPTRGNGPGIRYLTGSTSVDKAPLLLTGIIAMASLSAYRNGIFDQALSAWENENNTSHFYIGAFNQGGSATLPIACLVSACAIFLRTLTAAEVLAISSAMALF